MKIPLVGATSQQYSRPFDDQRTVNFYPVFDQMGKEPSALYGTPGLRLFADIGQGEIRGAFSATNGRAFVVSGGRLYEISSDGIATQRGTLTSTVSPVSIDENGFQLAICDGQSVYIFTYATNAFVKVTDPDLPFAGTITFIGGYFVINKVGTGSFYISALYDGTSWNALDFATAETSPDELRRVFNAVGQLWLFGARTTEIWTNSGDSSFPFEVISGANMDVGVMSPHTVVALDNSIFWLGKNVLGQGVVYRARGFSPLRISTNAIELKLQAITDTDNIRAYTYQEDGHLFYLITGGGLETTLVYDVSTQLWHERAYTGDDGIYQQHRGSCGMFAFGKVLIGDREIGKVYEMSKDYFDDDGQEIASDRIYTHISNENIRQRYNSLEIGLETGIGLQSGQGEDPQIMLRLSQDGGRTWSNWYQKSMGRVGEYFKRVAFRRLGISRMVTFNIRITDPVKRALTGSYLF